MGLLVGKQNVGSRDLLLSVIRTPQQVSWWCITNACLCLHRHASPVMLHVHLRCMQNGNDAVECSCTGSAPAVKASSKAKATVAAGFSVHIDKEWVAEHAVQVLRMLPGGEEWLMTFLGESSASCSTCYVSTRGSPSAGTPRDSAKPSTLAEGLSVIGAYLFCPESGYQSALEALASLMSNLSTQIKGRFKA